MQVDHIGIATDDIDALRPVLEELLDVPVAHEQEFGDLRIVFLDLGNGYFELLEPLESEGTIARFLDTRGPGMHHVGLETDDIDRALATARELGVDLIDENPRPGAWGHTVAFLHPDSTGGVLIEFVEH